MRPRVNSFKHAARYCVDCLLLLACWALWIALGGLLAAQLGIAFSREFAVPTFVLRAIEEGFTASQVNARFGRATFDPTGGVLLENVSLSLPEFSEPVVDARAVFVELNPWLLLAGKFEATRVHATGVTLSVPAMLAPSGRSEPVLSELDFSIVPRATQYEVEHLTARIAGIAVSIDGTFQAVTKLPVGSVDPLPLIANIARRYPQLCRRLIRAADELAVLDDPQLHATLTASPDRGAVANASVTARGLKLPQLHGVEARELRARISFPLAGDAPAETLVGLIADELRVADQATLRRVQASVPGTINPAHISFAPTAVTFIADEVSARGFTLQSVSSRLHPSETLDKWSGDILSFAAGAPLAIEGSTDLTTKTADLQVRGAFAPALLEPIGAQIGRDVRPYIDFGEPVLIDLKATFRPGWKFERVAGLISARQIAAYHVAIDSATGHIEFDGRNFIARDATATLGENLAWGSFEQDLSTLKFRFLLNGRLRPLDISGWFGPWWPEFFQHFEFSTQPPDASVDVAGRWRAGHETTVFVFAESTSPKIRGTPLDYGRTLMFIRPNFFDGLEFSGNRGAGKVDGTFVRHIDLERHEWSKMTFDLDSTLDLETGGGLLGEKLAAQLAPFTFVDAPHVKASGHLDGPAAINGEHQTIQIQTRSTGDFTIYDFPARNVSFDATIEDDNLSLSMIEAQVANGTLTGSARLWGPVETRKLGFDVALRGGLLGEAVTLVTSYTAQRRGETFAAGENFMPGKSQVKLDLTLAAEGNFEDLLSYQGNGNAQLSGAGLGEVRLLGLLSELLDFTALRFTDAQLDFQLVGPDVIFPSLMVTGANSAIEGHGDYSLERGEMDFNARVYPFQESKSILQNMVGVVLLPLSTMLEVKLTGPLKQPKWAFVMGPTNFFRSLTQPAKPEAQVPSGDAPSAYLKR